MFGHLVSEHHPVWATFASRSHNRRACPGETDHSAYRRAWLAFPPYAVDCQHPPVAKGGPCGAVPAAERPRRGRHAAGPRCAQRPHVRGDPRRETVCPRPHAARVRPTPARVMLLGGGGTKASHTRIIDAAVATQ